MRVLPFQGNFGLSLQSVNKSTFVPKSDLERAIYILRNREPVYKLYYNYYDGNHDLRVSIEKMRNTFGYLFDVFCDNLCPTVVDSMSERLEVVGFTLESEDDETEVQMPIHANDFVNGQQINPNANEYDTTNPNGNTIQDGRLNLKTVTLPKKKKTLADSAWDVWRECRMKEVQNQIHDEALLCGDSYLVIWPNPNDKNKICAHPQLACEFYIETDPETQVPKYAAKVWVENNRRYVTLYYPDEIKKYISIEGNKDPKQDKDFQALKVEGEDWPLPNPFGRVPAFRFAHRSRMGGMGRSELQNVIPLQDALNKALMDLMVAMEFAALRQRWGTGIEIPKDPITGEEMKTFESGSDKFWHTAAKDAHFGEFEAADLNSFIQTHDSFRLEIARISRTPLHYFTIQTGNAPSGAALRTIEKPLVNKCEKAQTSFGDVWEDVTEFMLLLKGEIDTLGQTQLETNWKPAQTQDTKEDLEAAAIKESIGVSKRQILREQGYGDEQIQTMELENASSENSQNQQMNSDVLKAFNSGNNFGN